MGFHFEDVKVYKRDSYGHVSSKKTTVWKKNWKNLLSCLTDGWTVRYEEYKDEIGVLRCRGSAILEEKE